MQWNRTCRVKEPKTDNRACREAFLIALAAPFKGWRAAFCGPPTAPAVDGTGRWPDMWIVGPLRHRPFLIGCAVSHVESAAQTDLASVGASPAIILGAVPKNLFFCNKIVFSSV